MASLRLLLLFGLAALASLAFSNAQSSEEVASSTVTSPSGSCPSSYYVVSDRCILANPFIEGSWVEASYYCKTAAASFVEIDNLDFFLELFEFFKREGLDDHSYWLGARDLAKEGEWRWEVGGDVLPMGTPFWALSWNYGNDYLMEPLGANASNCLRMDWQRHMYLDDDDCGNTNSIMCQIPFQ